MDDQLYVPSLKTILTETQERNINDLRRTLQRENGAIYSRFCGSGKTLAMLTYLLAEGLGEEKKQALVVAPISALKAWSQNSQLHFSPQIQCIQVDKHNKNKLMNSALSRYQLVVINFETLIGAYEHACELRRKILIEEMDRLSDIYPSWQDASDLADMDRTRFEEARERYRQLSVYLSTHQQTPVIHDRIPFPELADKEELSRRKKARVLDYLFQYKWEWLIVDEAHEGRNRYKNRYASLMAVKAQNRIAMTATICSNGISDFVSMLDLIGKTPSEGWRGLSANVSRCIEYMNALKRRCVVFSPLEEDKAIERLYQPTSILIHVPLADEEEQKKYREALSSNQYKRIFAKITRLRQLCEGPSKTRAVLAYLERCVVAHGEKAVIFTEFVEYTESLGKAIRKAFPSIKLVVVTGKTDQKKRTTTLLDEVANHRGSAVYLVTKKIMALGVNMHFANHAIIISPWWNPTAAEQAMRRITRPQQRLSVRWVTFVMSGTVEESIDLVAYYKNKLNTRLLEGDIDVKMLEQITSKRAINRARLSANRLREIIFSNSQSSSPSPDDFEDEGNGEEEEEEGTQTLVMKSAIQGDTNAIIELLHAFSVDASLASVSSLDGVGDIVQVYKGRFDLVMENEDEIQLEKATPIDLSSQISTTFSSNPRDELRQQEIDKMILKRKKSQKKNEEAKRQRTGLSLLERQEIPKKRSTSTGRQTKVIDLFGNVIEK